MKMARAERRKAGREIVENEKLDARIDGTTNSGSGDTGIWVRDALGKLDDSEREILMLREYEQLSYDEIGTLMRVPLNTVRSRLFRARAAMKEQLRSVKV